MVNHAVTNSPRNAELSMQRDAAVLLYSNSIAGILISAIASKKASKASDFTTQAPDNHLLCRWGGDEFLLMLANLYEGEVVETQEQMAQLVSLGEDYLQGFHFAKPMEEQDIITYLKP